MKNMILVIVATIWTTYVAGFTIEQFDAWEAEWKVLQCGPYGIALTLEGWNCSHLEPQEVSDAFGDCEHKAVPESKNPMDFRDAACENKTIFEYYDSCVDEYKTDEIFVEKVGELDAAIECYAKWLAGHGIQTTLLNPEERNDEEE